MHCGKRTLLGVFMSSNNNISIAIFLQLIKIFSEDTPYQISCEEKAFKCIFPVLHILFSVFASTLKFYFFSRKKILCKVLSTTEEETWCSVRQRLVWNQRTWALTQGTVCAAVSTTGWAEPPRPTFPLGSQWKTNNFNVRPVVFNLSNAVSL